MFANRKRDHGLDERWYKALEPMSSVSLLAYTSYPLEQLTEARRLFINEQLDHPPLLSSQINADECASGISYLNNLAREIGREEKNVAIKNAYVKRIEELVDLNELLRAASARDDEMFLERETKLYGQVEKEVLAAACQFLKSKLKGEAGLAGTEAKDLLRQGESLAEPAPLQLEAGAFLRAQALFQEKFREELAILEALRGKQEAGEIKKVMDVFLAQERFNGWQAIIDADRSGPIRIEHGDKKIIIPEDKDVSAARIRELVMHEILTHVLRRQNGERSRLKLLGLGLAHYLPGEEGVAIFRQQLLKDLPGFPREIMWRYFFIALCRGEVDGKTRNFRQIYDLAEQFFRAENAEAENAAESAADQAWRLTVRMFRGVRGGIKGICFTKDLVYLNGYSRLIGVMRVKPERQELFDIGKLDVSNEEHVDLTRELGL